MNKIIQEIIEQLILLRKEIDDEMFRIIPAEHKEKGWRGSHVVISTKPPVPEGMGFYPEPRWITTPYADEIGWLFYRLRDVFKEPITQAPRMIRMEFYCRLANRIMDLQGDTPDKENNVSNLLLCVWDESYRIARELEKGEFQVLPIAPGGMIADDIK